MRDTHRELILYFEVAGSERLPGEQSVLSEQHQFEGGVMDVMDVIKNHLEQGDNAVIPIDAFRALVFNEPEDEIAKVGVTHYLEHMSSLSETEMAKHSIKHKILLELLNKACGKKHPFGKFLRKKEALQVRILQEWKVFEEINLAIADELGELEIRLSQTGFFSEKISREDPSNQASPEPLSSFT